MECTVTIDSFYYFLLKISIEFIKEALDFAEDIFPKHYPHY